MICVAFFYLYKETNRDSHTHTHTHTYIHSDIHRDPLTYLHIYINIQKSA
jgi:hypothetical protein